MTDPTEHSDLMTLRTRIAATPAAVHRALTDAAQLRVWFAEHAEVQPPDRYAFWGRHTPDGAAPHQRLLHIDDSTVRFSWTLGGLDTTTEFALAPEEGATIVTLTQTGMPPWNDMLEQNGDRALLHTFWALAIANLVDHVEGRPLTPKGDFSSPELRGEVTIAADPEAVYASLTEADRFESWFCARVDIEPQVGGRFAFGGFDADESPGVIVAAEPGRRFGIRWPDETTFTWELEGSAGQTRLTFVQTGFDAGPAPYGSWLGWLAGVAELRRYHEIDGWRPMLLDVAVPDMPQDAFTF